MFKIYSLENQKKKKKKLNEILNSTKYMDFNRS